MADDNTDIPEVSEKNVETLKGFSAHVVEALNTFFTREDHPRCEVMLAWDGLEVDSAVLTFEARPEGEEESA